MLVKMHPQDYSRRFWVSGSKERVLNSLLPKPQSVVGVTVESGHYQGSSTLAHPMPTPDTWTGACGTHGPKAEEDRAQSRSLYKPRAASSGWGDEGYPLFF